MDKQLSEQLNGLRGLAALFIMSSHYFKNLAPPINYVLAFGSEFAALFLMLSGFFAYYSYRNRGGIKVKHYLIQRAIRIYPIYLIAICLALSSIYFTQWSFNEISFLQVVGNLLCLQDNTLTPGTFVVAIGGNLWYMSYQWWSYVFFILIMNYIPLHRQKSFTLILTSLGIISYMYFPNQISKLVWYYTIFYMGCCVCDVFLTKSKMSKLDILFIPIMLLIWIIRWYGDGMNHYPHPYIEMRHIGVAWIAVIIYGVFKCFHIRRIMGLNKFAIFAPFSFSIFLFQIPIRHLCLYYINGFWEATFAAVAITLSVSYLIEVKLQPLWLKLINR